ncbi:LysR family transcriptional regulator [Oenococcus sp. UCMA 16435]|nr:LysR family transcriptional regulator [Oenococcus sp. UCMA 16435]MDI4584728.1 LysR family transcriptional regulator [Oenococcus sp. UCMA 14587]
MNIKQLEHFIEITDNLSISTAAQKLGLPQPFLSQQLKKIEKEYNTVLLERNTRHMKLTESGRMLYERGKQLLKLYASINNEISEISTGKNGSLSIGVTSSIGSGALPEWIANFNEKFPKVKFSIEEITTARILSSIEDDLIEIGIICTPLNSDKFEIIHLSNEPMMAISSKNSQFVLENNQINISSLADKPLLIYKRYETTIKNLCQKYGFKPNIAVKIDNTTTLISLAEKNLGIAIIPKDWLKFVDKNKINYCQIINKELFTYNAIIWKKNTKLSKIASNFVQEVKKEYCVN